MIVKMKKITLLCLADLKQESIDQLGNLGAVQLVSEKLNDSTDRQEQSQKLHRLERVINAITSFKAPSSFEPMAKLSNAELFASLEQTFNTYEEVNKEREQLSKQLENLTPWGNFDASMIEKLASQGIQTELCVFTSEEFKMFEAPDGVTLEVVSSTKGQVNAVAFFPVGLSVELPSIPLPSAFSMSQVEDKLTKLSATSSQLATQLANANQAKSQLAQLQTEFDSEYEFLAARDGIQAHGEIAVLTGYIPTPRLEELTKACKIHGWGIKVEEPTEDDVPPVLLNMPKWVEPIRPLLAFLGVLPGYREIDVSLPMLIFMTIFVGMIINDAGYGCIFLASSILGVYLTRKDAKKRQVLALCSIFSVGVVVWGLLCGSWFGVTIGGLDIFTDPKVKDANIQVVCFSLAALHMSLGHVLQMFKKLSFRNIMKHLGWIMILISFYIIVVRMMAYPGELPEITRYLLLCGIGLLLVFAMDWTDISSVFNFPFDVINCFTDTLSYIRLFAVGLAGGYLAMCFNSMSMDIMKSGPSWLVIPAGIALILLAHTLNIMLSLISVLVHGVRLNTLEFSNHTGLTWSGMEYKPLKKLKTNNTNNKKGD